MILYFSATGNSRWVAQQLAGLTGDTLCNLADGKSEKDILQQIDEAGTLGIVFPVHGWTLPRPVADFLQRLSARSLPRCKYRYAVCTCGDDAGKTMNHLNKRFPIDAAWSVIMPDTYIPLFKIDKPGPARGKIAAAREQIPQIAADVLARKSTWQVHEGPMPRTKSYVLQPLFERFLIGDKGFHVDEGCTSCGKCARLCPVDNIEMKNGSPVWNHRCIHCMACIHGCPQEVIQYKKATQTKARYRLKDYL